MIEAAPQEKVRAPAGAIEYLGPAEVVEVLAHGVTVSLPDGSAVPAALAFAMPYAPVRGDVLLVVGKGATHYAIGVLVGSGGTVLSFQGDVEVRAVDGKLSLIGDRGVQLRAPEVGVYATALQMVARDVTQRFDSVCQRVVSLLRVHAGEAQTLVDGSSASQAKRTVILTEETVTINGREVHLG